MLMGAQHSAPNSPVCTDDMEKCPMDVDVNIMNMGGTIHQATRLAREVSKRPCRYFYCKEAMEDVWNNIPWKIKGTIDLISVMTIITLYLSIHLKAQKIFFTKKLTV